MAEAPSSLRDWGEGVLEQYFKLLSGFAHDQSKELADKEKAAQVQPRAQPSTSSTASPPSPSPSSNASSCRVGLLNVLGLLSQAEKAYHSLYFFVAKGFLRKDSSLRSTFEAILVELSSLKESLKKLVSSGSVHLLCHLCDQVGQYVNARIEMIDFYERLGSSKPDTTFVPWSDFLSSLRGISEKNHKLFHHPLIGPVKSAFDFETEALAHLIEAQVHLEDYEFLPSLLSSNEASTKLDSWDALSHVCDEYRSPSKYGLSAVMSLTGR